MKKDFITKEVIPNSVIDISTEYNQTILPIFLYLKRRTNKDGECFLNFNSMLDYYSKDSYTKSKERLALEGLLFILLGSIEYVYGDYNNIIDTYETENSYQIDYYNVLLKHLCSTIQIEVSKKDNKLIFKSTDKDIDVETTLQKILKLLKQNNNILLYDLTIENKNKYLQVECSTLQYFNWYYEQQNFTLSNLQSKYAIKDNKKLLEYRETYQIADYGKSTTVNYTTLINLYFYIYKLYIYNKNCNKKTYISTSTLSNLLKASNTTIILYINILKEIKAISVSKGNFSRKEANVYVVNNKWKELYTDLNNFRVYRYTIISSQQFSDIKSCYNKIITTTTDNTNTEIPVKRKRGRPKKNNII